MTSEPNLWTKAETAAFLHISARTLDSWCAARLIPFSQLPCGRRFDPAKVKAFVRSREFGHLSNLQVQDNARIS